MSDQSVAKASTYTEQHNTEKRGQISMPQAGFEPTISRVQANKAFVSDRAATGTA
jgi:hypothetical protein